MQLIAVDIGNSSTKIGLGHKERNSDGESTGNDHWDLMIGLPNEKPIAFADEGFKLPEQPAMWAVSSVNSARAKELGNWIEKHRPKDRFHLIAESEVDLKSDVQSRKQLGRDRLIAAWMAVQLNHNVGPIIVVDAGNAVTIDLVDEQLVFQGGNIFPGADSNFQQLAQKTDALPAVSHSRRIDLLEGMDFGVVGKSTEQAIFDGIYQSQIGAITAMVAAISKRLAIQPTLYATGGGIEDISKFLPESWNRIPDLVLRGAIGIGRQLA